MNVAALIEALASNQAEDALRVRFDEEGWSKLSKYFQVVYMQPGLVLMEEGDNARDLYIVIEGNLSVQIRGNPVANLGPGTVVGEGAFFSGGQRSATVLSTEAGVAWRLERDKLDTMAANHARTTLELVSSRASVLAVRMRTALLVGHFA